MCKPAHLRTEMSESGQADWPAKTNPTPNRFNLLGPIGLIRLDMVGFCPHRRASSLANPDIKLVSKRWSQWHHMGVADVIRLAFVERTCVDAPCAWVACGRDSSHACWCLLACDGPTLPHSCGSHVGTRASFPNVQNSCSFFPFILDGILNLLLYLNLIFGLCEPHFYYELLKVIIISRNQINSLLPKRFQSFQKLF